MTSPLSRPKTSVQKFEAYKKYLADQGFDLGNENERELKERFTNFIQRDPKLAETIFN